MKYRLITLTLCLACSGLAHSAETCQEKQEEIQRQITYAQQHDNQYRVTGLQTALAELKANCQDTDLQRKQQRKIAEKQLKVDERKLELQQAEQYGDQKKIAKQRKKLREAEEELHEVQIGDD